MAVLVGVDVGTSGTRALAVTADGELVAEATRPHELLTPRPGWTEQRPAEWWEATKAVLREVAGAAGDDIVGLGVTGQMHGSVFLGDGQGKLLPPSAYSAAGSTPLSILAVDLDSDLAPDLVTTNHEFDSILVRLNDGTGKFGPTAAYACGGGPTYLALGDVDGDQRVDVVTTNPDTNDASIMRGDGQGAFSLFAKVPVGTNPFMVTLGDLDGDGDLDLALGTWNDGVQLWRNTGSPRAAAFTGPEPLVELSRGSHASPALADLDGDGDLDLVAGESSGEVNLWRNDGTPREPRFTLVTDRLVDLAQRHVGPAGALLNRCLASVGIDRDQAYVSNVVKHFKWEPRGKRRIHKKPNAIEIAACRPWLEAEVALVKPDVIVALGATAAQSLLGAQFRVTKQRGEFIESALAPYVMATVHPSSILRAPDDETRQLEYRRFLDDLKKLARVIKPK